MFFTVHVVHFEAVGSSHWSSKKKKFNNKSFSVNTTKTPTIPLTNARKELIKNKHCNFKWLWRSFLPHQPQKPDLSCTRATVQLFFVPFPPLFGSLSAVPALLPLHHFHLRLITGLIKRELNIYGRCTQTINISSKHPWLKFHLRNSSRCKQNITTSSISDSDSNDWWLTANYHLL